jgi:hypothetical protein
LCFFCGESAPEHDAVKLVARWDQDGNEMWQLFFAHGACFTGQMHESVGSDGRIFDRFANPSS